MSLPYINALPSDTPTSEYDCEECCPHCDEVNKFKVDDSAKMLMHLKCNGCEKVIVLCSLCEEHSCKNCPHEEF